MKKIRVIFVLWPIWKFVTYYTVKYGFGKIAMRGYIDSLPQNREDF